VNLGIFKIILQQIYKYELKAPSMKIFYDESRYR